MLALRALPEGLEDVGNRSGDQASVSVPLAPARDREGLAATTLPVREDRAVDALHHVLDDGLRHDVEHLVLRDVHGQDAIEFVLVAALLVVRQLTPRLRSVQVEGEHALLGLAREAVRWPSAGTNADEHLDVRLDHPG